MADTNKQTKEQKEALEAAQKAAPSEKEQLRMKASVPPLQRDSEHSFVSADETDVPAASDPELAQPNLTNTSLAEAECQYQQDEDSNLKLTRPDRAKSTYEQSSALGEVDLERLSDDQIKDANVLTKATPRYHPARIAPSSDRPRQPGERAPAAGAGSWPLNESQMPAVMPTDPPVEDREDLDNGFASSAGFRQNKDGTLARKGLKIEKSDVTAAAALYARLRQQFPGFTKDQLADEFELQWLSGTAGQPQSHREGEGLSQHGLTAVGDVRVAEPDLGKLRSEAYEADPAEPTPGAAPAAGLPSTNEPATKAPDAAKENSGETAEADAKAAEQIAKFDHDGDGNVGGSKPKTK